MGEGLLARPCVRWTIPLAKENQKALSLTRAMLFDGQTPGLANLRRGVAAAIHADQGAAFAGGGHFFSMSQRRSQSVKESLGNPCAARYGRWRKTKLGRHVSRGDVAAKLTGRGDVESETVEVCFVPLLIRLPLLSAPAEAAELPFGRQPRERRLLRPVPGMGAGKPARSSSNKRQAALAPAGTSIDSPANGGAARGTTRLRRGG